MAIELGDNIKLGLGLPNDARYYNTSTNKPWTGVTQVNAALAGGAGGVRYTGLTVNIGGTEYWYKDGIGDGDLIEKESGGGTITGGTNGLSTAGADIVLGGSLTGNTCVGLGNNIFCVHDSNADGLYVSNGGFSADICDTTSFITMTSGETYIWSENPNSSCAEVILLDNDNACMTFEYDNMVLCGKGNQPARYLADYSANISCLSIPNAGWVTGQTGGGLAMSGSTVGGLTTYVDANTICAQPNLTFTGSTLSVTGELCATTNVCAEGLVICHPTNNGIARFESGDATVLLYLKDSGTTGNGYFVSRTDDALNFYTNDSTRLCIDAAGDVNVINKLCTSTLQVTTGAASGCVLTSDGSGNATWQSPAAGGIAMSGSTVGGLTTYVDGSTICAQPKSKYNNGSLTLDGNLNLTGGSTGTRYVQIGQGRDGDGYAYLDFIGDTTYTDYGLRMIRDNSGANANSILCHRGTGQLLLSTVDTADICLCTPNAATRIDCLSVNQTNYTLNAWAQFETTDNNPAIRVYGHTGSTSNNCGLIVSNKGGTSNGGNTGIYVDTVYDTPSTAGRSHGIWSRAGNKTDRYNYGVIGELGGSQEGAGIVGIAPSCGWTTTLPAGCFAGVFYGNMCTTGGLNIDGIINSCSSSLQSVRIQAGTYYSAYDCSGSINRMMGMASGSDLMTFGSIENTSAPICIYIGGGYKHEFCPNGAVDMYGPLTMTNGDIIFSQGAERTICVAEATDGGNGDTLNIFAGKGDSDTTPGYGGCLRLLGGDGGDNTGSGAGGAGCYVFVRGGTGGASTGSVGGEGGRAIIRGGQGGAGYVGGNGGEAQVCGGDAGSSTYVDGCGGNVLLRAGCGYASGTDGCIIIQGQSGPTIDICNEQDDNPYIAFYEADGTTRIGYFRACGTSNAMVICNDGGGSICLDNTTSYLNSCSSIYIRTNGTENAFIGLTNSYTAMYYDNSQKIKTCTYGGYVSGCICASTCGIAPDWVATSDRRLKEGIVPINNALSIVTQLCGITYCRCCDEKHEKSLGLIAQDVLPVLPEAVSHSTPTEDDQELGICDEVLGIKYSKLTAVLIEAIKEQQQQITCLQQEIKELKNN